MTKVQDEPWPLLQTLLLAWNSNPNHRPYRARTKLAAADARRSG